MATHELIFLSFLFAAACMTWELAESGMPFVTAVVNGSDLVPTFCVASADDLRAEASKFIT